MEGRMVAEFRWSEIGDGEPVLFLHGLFGGAWHWETALEALGPGWRGMALTLPIFEMPPDDLSVASLRRYVEDFLECERVPSAVLVGNSLGGQVALELALHAPARVRALLLTGSAGLLERTATRTVPHRPSSAFVRERMAEVFHDPSLVTPAWVESVRELVGQRSYALRVLQITRSARRSNLEARLGQVRCPTRLVWGTHDRITPVAEARRFLRGIPGADLRLIPRCGHAPMIEQPDVFGRALVEFLDELSLDPVAAR